MLLRCVIQESKKAWQKWPATRAPVELAGLALAAIGHGDGAHGGEVVSGLRQAVHARMVAPSRGGESRR